VISWTLGLLNGGDSATGSMTSGGTESILMAVKTARDWARQHHPNVKRPVVVAPFSAHPAFNKAAHYLGMEVRRVPIGDDFRADMKSIGDSVDERTVMLVGSAPQFAHGVFDPISDLAELAQERNLWLHIDACVGGFIAPFARELGQPIPDFDFTIPGVTSMSADLHKYGFTAKGASTFLLCKDSLRKYQIFEFDEWSRGHYASPTVPGTRPGGPIAAAWAVLNYLGRDGYLRIAAELFDAIDRLKKGIRSIDGLSIIADPPLTILSYTSSNYDIFAVAKAMTQRGWFVTRSAEPRAIHMGMLTMTHIPIVDQYLTDLAESVDQAKSGKVKAYDEAITYGG
jgi:glutamate/tyrosine decarboxylase-like PLP-dependent enzyme